MQKTLLIAGLTLLLGSISYLQSTQQTDLSNEYASYKQTFGKVYNGHEDTYRRAVYEQNVARIEAHNADPTRTYDQGINQFTDLTQEEFVATYLTLQLPEGWQANEFTAETDEPNDSVDWSSSVHVKNQGSCGSCWAFSTTGAIEAYQKIVKGVTVSLSEQQLVDCDKTGGSSGCNGGDPHSALVYAGKNGLQTETAYPYTGKTESCKHSTGTKYSTGASTVSASSLKAAIKVYPVSVAVDATNWSSYTKGTFSNCAKSLNHAVLAVGYDASGNWIVKNSWGTTWGVKGFITLASGDTCGVTQYANKAI